MNNTEKAIVACFKALVCNYFAMSCALGGNHEGVKRWGAATDAEMENVKKLSALKGDENADQD